MYLLSIEQYKEFKLFEAAISLNDISNNVIVLAQSNKKSIKLCLYDYITKDILGYITADKMSNMFCQIDRIASDKGYGPLLYDLLMQYLSPLGLKPATKIKQKALNVWTLYYNTRQDVIKIPLPKDDVNYADYYVNDDSDNAPILKDKISLDIINTIYYKKPTSQFNVFITKSLTIIKDNDINVNSVFKNALDYFQSKYYNVNASYVYENNLIDEEEYYFLQKDLEYVLTTKSKILAYGNLLKKDNYYIFDKIYGPGYGLKMHQLVLMSMYPNKIRPSASSKQSVIRIWEHIYASDFSIKSNAKDIWNSYDDGILPNQTNKLELVNTLYSIKPTNEFNMLLNKSNEFLNKMTSILPNYIDKRIRLGRELYTNSYIEI